MASFVFRKAIREKTSLIVGIAGASGSGKTYSALRLATGLVGPKGRIAFIDTEAGRGLHYADKFDFDYTELTPPFTPARYREAISAAEDAGYDAILVDSATHEYEGEGGIVEWAARLESEGTKSPGNWKVPKTEHKKMVSRVIQCRAHLILCFRAEEKIRIEKVEEGGRTKTVVVPIGWTPITEKRFLYELTTSILMTPDKPGIAIPVKIQEQHLHCFPEGERVGEQVGKLLGVWAQGGAAPDKASVQAAARRVAATGTEEYRAYWSKLDRTTKATLLEIQDELKATAAAVDAEVAGADRETGEIPSSQDREASTSSARPPADEREAAGSTPIKPAASKPDDDAEEEIARLMNDIDHTPSGIDVNDVEQVRAYLQGMEAADAGVSRRAPPPELRDEKHQVALAAWTRGHNHVTGTA